MNKRKDPKKFYKLSSIKILLIKNIDISLIVHNNKTLTKLKRLIFNHELRKANQKKKNKQNK